jgi:hypothetical protein
LRALELKIHVFSCFRTNLRTRPHTRPQTQSDGLPALLASRRERLEEVQARCEQLSILITNLKCGIAEHLWQALKKNDKQVRLPPSATKEDPDQEALKRMLKDLELGLVELMRKTG